MTNSWTYKVFYYTVLSFALIASISSLSGIIRTAFYQGFDIQDSGTSLFGLTSSSNNQDKTKVYAKQYLDSTITLVTSVSLAVIFVYFLKPRELHFCHYNYKW